MSVLLTCWLLYGKVSSLGSKATEEEPVSTREVLDDAVPFLAIAMTAFVLQAADIWILGALNSGMAVAVYANASKLVTFVVMPLLVVNLVMPPSSRRCTPRAERVRWSARCAPLAPCPACLRCWS